MALGSINIGKHAFKQSGDIDESYIRSTTFTSIDAGGGNGAIYTEHLIGSFTLTSVDFDGNISASYSCGIHVN